MRQVIGSILGPETSNPNIGVGFTQSAQVNDWPAQVKNDYFLHVLCVNQNQIIQRL
jgi:hypothetical protein